MKVLLFISAAAFGVIGVFATLSSSEEQHEAAVASMTRDENHDATNVSESREEVVSPMPFGERTAEAREDLSIDPKIDRVAELTAEIVRLEARCAELEQQLRLCERYPDSTPFGAFLRSRDAEGMGAKTKKWIGTVLDYYPMELLPGEALVLAEREQELTTPGVNWHRGVIEVLGAPRIKKAAASWSSQQQEKLFLDMGDELAAMIGIGAD